MATADNSSELMQPVYMVCLVIIFLKSNLCWQWLELICFEMLGKGSRCEKKVVLLCFCLRMCVFHTGVNATLGSC